MLGGGLALGVLALTGCGIRLEDDAPEVPLVPRREPIPAESALLTVLTALATGDQEHDAVRADALQEALASADVPAEDLDAARTAVPVARGEQVIAYEAAVGGCPASMLTLMGSLMAGRMLDGDIPVSSWSAPAEGSFGATAVAAEALAATEAADYAMTLVEARGGEALGERTRSTRRVLADLVLVQAEAADDDGTSTALGYDVDPVDGRAEATRLAQQTLTRLGDRYVRLLPRLSAERESASAVVGWVATVQRRARTWGVDDQVLPGMQV